MVSNIFPTVGVAIITHNAEKHIKQCLAPLLLSDLNPRLIVVNSSSRDRTVEIAEELGVETLILPRSSFNHGSTREIARRFLETDIVVMLTPDAYFTHPKGLKELIMPLVEQKASVSYARQLPRKNACFFEKFERDFYYSTRSEIRGIEDFSKRGIEIFFCSNSCAAWNQAALDEIKGFPKVLLGEDTLATMQLLNKGGKIAYVAESEVVHSHPQTIAGVFCRSFDTGFARSQFPKWVDTWSHDHKRGIKFAKKMFKHAPYTQVFRSVLLLSVKWFGYQLGRISNKAPKWFKRKCSSQKYYWR